MVSDEVACKQQCQKEPAEFEHGVVPDDRCSFGEFVDIDCEGNVLSEVEPEYGDGSDDAQQVWQEHMPGILHKADVEVAGGDDVGEVGDYQRVGGAVTNEAAGHQKGEDGQRFHFEVFHFCQQNRGQNECRTVVGEEGGHHGTQQQDVDEHFVAASAAEFGHFDGSPFKKADLIEYHGEENDADEGKCGIPYDLCNGDDIVKAYDPQ